MHFIFSWSARTLRNLALACSTLWIARAQVEELSGEQARELEPALPAGISRAFYYPGEMSVVNPLRLTQSLARRFVALGGTIIRDEARGFDTSPGAAPTVRISQRSLSADTVVVAAGAWSGQLAKQLGLNLPMQAERGYHVMLPDCGVELGRPISFGDRLVSMSPMEEGLRIASGAEFAPADQAADWSRIEPLLSAVRELFPSVSTEGYRPWMGPRPSLPDSIPAIGASKRHPEVLFACGHGQLGLTLSAVTARLLGDLASGSRPDIDMAPYSPDRFNA